MSIFDQFESIKKTTNSKPELSPKRIGRITGSNYDKIAFETVRHEKGGRATKSDMIDWIKKQGRQELLEQAVYNAGVQNFLKLPKKDIESVYYSIEGTKRMTKGCESYLDYLLSFHTCKEAKARYEFTSNATDHGNTYEPQAIAAFEKWFINEHGNEYEIKEGNTFFINPNNRLLGSTPDSAIYFKGCIEPEYALETKCPKNPSNHARKLRRQAECLANSEQLDPRYKKQRLGYFLNMPTIEAVFFASFDPDASKKEFELHVVTMMRRDYEKEIQQLRVDLNLFSEIYTSKMDLMGINYDHLLIP